MGITISDGVTMSGGVTFSSPQVQTFNIGVSSPNTSTSYVYDVRNYFQNLATSPEWFDSEYSLVCPVGGISVLYHEPNIDRIYGVLWVGPENWDSTGEDFLAADILVRDGWGSGGSAFAASPNAGVQNTNGNSDGSSRPFWANSYAPVNDADSVDHSEGSDSPSYPFNGSPNFTPVHGYLPVIVESRNLYSSVPGFTPKNTTSDSAGGVSMYRSGAKRFVG